MELLRRLGVGGPFDSDTTQLALPQSVISSARHICKGGLAVMAVNELLDAVDVKALWKVPLWAGNDLVDLVGNLRRHDLAVGLGVADLEPDDIEPGFGRI